MSENPYAPPKAELGVPGAGPLEGRGDFEIGRCLSEAWAGTWANFPLWLGAGLVWGVATLFAAVTVIGLLLVPVLAWGATRFVLRMYDGEAEFGDVFSGFSRFGDVFVPMLSLSVIFMVLSLLVQSVQFYGAFEGNNLVYGIGYAISIAFGLLVSPRLMMSFFYLVDRDLPALDALSQAWRDTGPTMWKLVLLMILSQVIVFAGVLALLVGVIPASVMSYLLFASAFRQLAGRPAAV